MENQAPKIPARAGMRNQWLVLMCLMGLVPPQAGCGDAAFSVNVGTRDAGEPGEAGNEDAGAVGVLPPDGGMDASDAADSAALVCEPYSCKPGCGSCDEDAGMACGHSGTYLCGSQNCGRNLTSLDAGFPCATTELPSLYTCQGATGDVLPGCVYSGTAMGQRWYCCR